MDIFDPKKIMNIYGSLMDIFDQKNSWTFLTKKIHGHF